VPPARDQRLDQRRRRRIEVIFSRSKPRVRRGQRRHRRGDVSRATAAAAVGDRADQAEAVLHRDGVERLLDALAGLAEPLP
jgi:hypothetical protein